MVCLPATIQCFKWLLLFDLGPSCSLFIRRMAAESRFFVVPALRLCGAPRYLHGPKASQARWRSLLLIKTKRSTITVSAGLKPRYLISQTYLSTRDMKNSNAMNGAIETQGNLTHLAPLASFPPHVLECLSESGLWDVNAACFP